VISSIILAWQGGS